MAPYNGTQQWHHVHSPKVGRHPPQPPTTMAPYNGTQQWHHVHCTLQWHPGATSNPPKWFVALPPIGSKNPYSYRYLGKNETTTSSFLCYQNSNLKKQFRWSGLLPSLDTCARQLQPWVFCLEDNTSITVNPSLTPSFSSHNKEINRENTAFFLKLVWLKILHPLFNSLVREPIFQIQRGIPNSQRGIPSSQPGIPNSLSSGSFTLEAAKNCNFFTKAFLSSKIRSKFDMLRLKSVRTWKKMIFRVLT